MAEPYHPPGSHPTGCGCALCRLDRTASAIQVRAARIVGAEDADDILAIAPDPCPDCGDPEPRCNPTACAIAAHVRGDIEPGTRAADDARLASAQAAELERLAEADLLDRYVLAVAPGYVSATVKHADDVDAQAGPGYDLLVARRLEEMAAAWLAERRKRL